MLAILSPITNFILGPSPAPEPITELAIYPLFGPITTCFFSKTHAPFTVVLNAMEIKSMIIRVGLLNEILDENTARLLDNGE